MMYDREYSADYWLFATLLPANELLACQDDELAPHFAELCELAQRIISRAYNLIAERDKQRQMS